MKYPQLMYHGLLCFGLSFSLYFNFSLLQDIDKLKAGVISANGISMDASMKVETALQMLSTDGPREVERIAEEVYKKMKEKELRQEENQ